MTEIGRFLPKPMRAYLGMGQSAFIGGMAPDGIFDDRHLFLVKIMVLCYWLISRFDYEKKRRNPP